jgi:hypothetical protein
LGFGGLRVFIFDGIFLTGLFSLFYREIVAFKAVKHAKTQLFGIIIATFWR